MFKRSVIAMACIFALSACGGGGGGSPDVKSADTLSKPAAPVVSEKETEAKEDAPQAGSQGQGAPSAQGGQDMAAVSEENTGNGGAAATDKPKNEDEGAQNDMPQNAADTDSLTPNHTPASNMPAGNMENQAPDAGESEQPANQPDMANTADGMQGDDPSAGGENAGNTAAQGTNQAENNQTAGSQNPASSTNPSATNSGGDFGRTNVGNSVVIDGPSQNITLTHCKGDSCSGNNFLDEEVQLKSEFEKLSDADKISNYKKDGKNDGKNDKFVGLVADSVQMKGINQYIIFYKPKPTSFARFRRSARSRRSLPAEMPLIPVNQADTLIVDGEAVSLTGHSGNIFAPEGNYRYLTYGAEKLPGGSYALRVQGEPSKGEMLAGTAVYNAKCCIFIRKTAVRPRPEAGLPQKSISAANLWTALSTAAMVCIWVRKNSKPPSMETALRGLGRKMAAGMFPESFTARPARKWRENTAIAQQMRKRADSACLPAKKSRIDADAA